jgi:tRNA threonylcarbamoyladenosine biosynthesis protein TsaB
MSTDVILAIDTATPHGGVALWQADRLLVQALLSAPREHSKRLFGEIENALTLTQLDRSQLSAVAVSIGPGSFTGLRIGLSAAKGICRALQIPLVAVSTLEALAARLPWATRPVCCLLDARRGEVYAAVYDTSDGSPRCVEAPHPTSLSNLLVRWGDRDALFTGDGVDLLYAEKQHAELLVAPAHLRAPDAGALAWLGMAKFRAGDIEDIAEVEPEYLRIPTFVTMAEQASHAG